MFYRIALHSGKQIAVNLNLVRTVTKNGKILEFHLGPLSFTGNFIWLDSDSHFEEVEFETEERAQQEYDTITQLK